MENNKKYMEDMINRYTYEVTKRLPASQRQDIGQELRSLIEDMLAEKSDKPTAADLDALLLELGKPSKMTDKYRENKRYLIGPEYYDLYFLVLKIVVIATTIGLSIALFVSFMMSPQNTTVDFAVSYFTGIFTSVFQAFAWVTIVFMLIERSHKGETTTSEMKWKPSDLAPVPSGKQLIKRWEPIVGIIFLTLIMILFNFAPELLGIYVSKDGSFSQYPLFNSEILTAVLPLINIGLFVGLVKETFRLIIGKHNVGLAMITTICNVIAVGLLFIVFSNSEIWNLDIANSAFGNYLNMLQRSFAAVLVFAFCVDSGTAWLRAFKTRD